MKAINRNKKSPKIAMNSATSVLLKNGFSKLIHNIDAYAIVLLDKKGILLTWNAGAEKINGFKANEVIGQHASIFYTKEALEKNQAEEDFKIARTDIQFETEDWRVRKNGEKFWASEVISALYNDKGILIGYGKIIRDLTYQKKIDTLKNDFISVVSHELRTPLTSIQGSLALLLAGVAGQLPESAMRLLSIGKQNSERLIRLINNILDIHKIESGKMDFINVPLHIDLIVREAVLINEPFAGKFNIEIELIQKSTSLVNVDKDKLLQVLTNIITNSIKFSTPGSKVTICVQKKADKIQVSITNKGSGIPLSFQSRIFEKFAQANSSSNRAYSGSGLGLSISKEIMGKLGGTISFVSVPDKETTFTIELPFFEKLLDTKKIFAKIPMVLICENDVDSAEQLKDIFENQGCHVLVANTATEAKKIIADMEIDVLLLDLLLPDEDGITLIKYLRKRYASSELAIIVISVIAKEGQKKLKGNAISVLDWLEKPIDLPHLLNTIKLVKKTIEIKTPTILHIEDDPGLIEIIAQLLQREATVLGVTTLEQARIELQSTKVDLVILDIMLPDGSGIDLLPLISKKHIPVIVFSAYELPNNYSQFVVKSLLKSKASPYELLENINLALHHNKIPETET